MRQIACAAIAGIVSSSLLPALPPAASLPWLAALAAGLALHRAGRLAAAVLAGSVLYCFSAQAQLASKLNANPVQSEFKFTAQIVDFPEKRGNALRLVLAPRTDDLPSRIRLNWYRATAMPALGEHWEFRARLRRPRGSRNPGGFDYAGWLHRERIGATGYVVAAVKLADAPVAGMESARQHLQTRLRTLLPAGDARAALLAIGLGARNDITPGAWDRYAVTGTSHLMAISGLHVGLAASGAALLAWGALGLCVARSNLRDLALAVALPAALLYTAIAGFALPSQRALLMTAAATVYLWMRQAPPPAWALLWSALILLAIDPLTALAPGFFLSFGAVAVLLYRAAEQRQLAPPGQCASLRNGLHELGALQLALMFGLLPLTGLLFARTTWLAPLANLLVLPLFSVVTVPSALLGMLLDGFAAPVGDGLLWLSWYSLAVIHGTLYWLAAIPGARIELAQPVGVACLVFLLPLIWVVLPRGFPGRQVAWLGLLAVLLYRPAAPPVGCVDVHTLDVGQGLAVVVRTSHHALLFDTGPGYANGGSSVEYVVEPFLQSLGLRRLDAVVISHADNDHAGGLAPLLEQLPVDTLLGGEALPTSRRQQRCAAGEQWAWDEVRFDILHPSLANRLDGNNASCVLQISAGAYRVLLTGDIEAAIERRLLRQQRLAPVALVQVPHHGSRTSSSIEFVQAVAADTAVVSAGFQNRWGFPKDDIVARWRAAGTELYNTATSGALHHRICPATGLRLVSEHRLAARRYWHDTN